MYWILLLIPLLYLFYKYVKKRQSYWQEKGVAYLNPTFLIGGSGVFFRKKAFGTVLEEQYKRFPNDRYYGNYNFLEPSFIIRDPELIKEVLIKSFDHFMDHRTFADYEVDKFWGKNLITSSGERWRNMRAALSPSFTGSKMRVLFDLMEQCTRQLIQHVKNIKPNQDNIIEVNAQDIFSRFSNDVIATTAFGIDINSLDNPNNEFYRAGKEAVNFGTPSRMLRIASYMFSPTLGKILKVKIIPEKLEKYFTGVIAETLRVRKEHNVRRPDMIQQLLDAQESQNKGEVTLDDIASHAFLFFVAGFDAASILLTFACYELLCHPEIQERLRKEILAVDEPITFDAIQQMKYLDMVVSETLRKWPPSTFAERLVTKEFVIEPVLPHEKPVVLEKGIDCMMPIVGLHHDPAFYPDPETFDPERFSDENKHKINHGAYIPFGAGPRICIGNRFALMEGKLLICSVLKSFELVAVSRTTIPLELDPSSVNMKIKGGLWMGLKPLKN